MLGQILGDYELQQEIGHGPSATVYVARQHPVERYVAVKVFAPQSREVTTRLRDRYAQLEQLDHTHILPIYDQGRWQDRHYWVMRYMPAGSLKTRLGKQRLTLEEIDRVLPQIAAALDHAHGHGVIHGDLKLTDILLDHAGQAFVADFGVSAALGRSASATQAPELRHNTSPDARADVYGLGAILYELLTTRPPIDPRAPDEERANRSLIPPAPSTINAKIPATLDAVVLKALAVDPDQRFQTPSELVDAYVQARLGKPAELLAAAALSGRVRRVSTRRVELQKSNRWKIAGLIGGVLLAVLLIAVVFALAAQTPAVVAPRPTETIAPTPATPIATTIATPIATPTAPPASPNTPTVPATSTSEPTQTPTAAASPTVTLLPTRVGTRLFATATPTVSIAPLALVIPRQENRQSLGLTFSTNVLPPDAGVIGTLSLSVPEVEPFVSDRTLAQVGSGEQVLRVAVEVSCARMTTPVTSRQAILTLLDAQGRVLLTQTFEYIKRWCG
jgi:serine/threonine protein kinase